MKLPERYTQCDYFETIVVCDMLALGRLRTIGEADDLVADSGDLMYYDYLTIGEEDKIYGKNH